MERASGQLLLDKRCVVDTTAFPDVHLRRGVVNCVARGLLAEALHGLLWDSGYHVRVTTAPEHVHDLGRLDPDAVVFDADDDALARRVGGELQHRAGRAVSLALTAEVDSRRRRVIGYDGAIVVAKSAGAGTLLSALDDALAGKRVVADQGGARRRSGRESCELTGREHDVLRALVDGCTTTEAADRLGITVPSARTYVQRLLTKLDVHSRAAAVARAASLGLVSSALDPVALGSGVHTGVSVGTLPGA